MRKRGHRAGWALASSAIALAASAEAAETVTYGYDSLGRLVRVERSGSVNASVKAYYTYDPADNRINVTVSTPAAPLPPPPLPAPVPVPSTTIPPPPPPPLFSIAGGSADEGSNLQFTITRSGTGNQGLSVGYSTSNGTASAASDFHPVSGTASFVPGQATLTVAVALLRDDEAEPAETLTMSLSAPSGNAILAAPGSAATGTINESFAPPPAPPPPPGPTGPTPPSPPTPPTVTDLKAPIVTGPEGVSPAPTADPGAPADPAGPAGPGSEG